MNNKPKIKLTGQDGNIFNLIGIAAAALKKAGMHKQAAEMTTKIFRSGDYHEALGIITEYCEVH